MGRAASSGNAALMVTFSSFSIFITVLLDLVRYERSSGIFNIVFQTETDEQNMRQIVRGVSAMYSGKDL